MSSIEHGAQLSKSHADVGGSARKVTCETCSQRVHAQSASKRHVVSERALRALKQITEAAL